MKYADMPTGMLEGEVMGQLADVNEAELELENKLKELKKARRELNKRKRKVKEDKEAKELLEQIFG